MIRGEKFSFLPDLKYFHFEADAISCAALFNIFFPQQGGLAGGTGGILYHRHVHSGSESMQVIGSSGRMRSVGDAISILRQFNPSEEK